MKFDWLAFFRKSQDSLKGYIKGSELVKAIMLAIGAGGGLWGFLEVMQDNLSNIVIDPVLLLNIQQMISRAVAKDWIALALGLITLSISLYNKFNQGAVVLNPSSIPEAKSLVVEPVVKKTEAEKKAQGIVAPKTNLPY